MGWVDGVALVKGLVAEPPQPVVRVVHAVVAGDPRVIDGGAGQGLHPAGEVVVGGRAAFGNEEGVLQSDGGVAEEGLHFSGRAEEVFVVGAQQVVGVLQNGLVVNAAEDIVQLPLTGVEVVSVPSGDDVEAGAVGQRRQAGQEAVIAPQIVTLELDEEAVRAEEVSVTASYGESLFPFPLQQEARDLPAAAAREGDQAMRMGSEMALVELGLPFLPIAAGQGDEAAEVGVPLGVLYQERQVRALLLVCRSTEGDLAAQDGLDAHLPSPPGKANCPVEGVVVGEGHGRHPEISSTSGQRLRRGDAVEEAVGGMGVELGVAGG
jgi:hypothetical protein